MAIMYRADSIIPEVATDVETGLDLDGDEKGEQEEEVSDMKASEDQKDPKIIRKSYDTTSKTLDAHGWTLVSLAYQAVGVVYGDIGTSPLYVLNGIFDSDGPAPSEEDVIGVISTIVWIFTIVVICKYALIVLQFGTGMGEGGTFALYQTFYPKSYNDDLRDDTTYGVATTTHSIGGLAGSSFKADRREKLLRHPWIKPTLCAWALFGSGLTIADGIITPAVSVVSAAEGIAVVKPEEGDNTRPIAIAILVAIILAQSLGIKKLSVAYSPLVLLWFLFLFLTGAYNCHLYPGIWRAWDPSRAVLYFVRTKNYDALSGVLLAVTGCEALFANLGQLGQRAIQLPLIFVVYPSLMLAYLGQGSQLVVNGPTIISNIFYLSIPGGAGGAIYWIGFTTGLLATIIASQAMLTASFSIVSQLVHMKSFPSVKQKYPSDDYGQCYIPVVNYAMGAAIVAVVAGFATSTHLTNAYGFAVATVMIVTTSEVALSIYFVKGKPIILGVLFFIFFGFVDCLLWGSTWHKLPEGAWFSLGVGMLLALFMVLWTWLSSLIESYDRINRLTLNHLIQEGPDEKKTQEKNSFQQQLILHGLDHQEKQLPRSDMIAVFWKPSSGNGVPHSFSHFLTKYPSCPSVVIFLSVKILAVPSIPSDDSIIVRRVRRFPGFYTATLRQGYKDHLKLELLNIQLANQIQALEQLAGSSKQQIKSTVDYICETQKTFTHIYPSYYPAARPMTHSIRSQERGKLLSLLSPKVLWWTSIDLVRGFLIEDIYRRLKGAFAEEDGPFDAREEVIRVVVTAVV